LLWEGESVVDCTGKGEVMFWRGMWMLGGGGGGGGGMLRASLLSLSLSTWESAACSLVPLVVPTCKSFEH
jgi:hypothetical protein